MLANIYLYVIYVNEMKDDYFVYVFVNGTGQVFWPLDADWYFGHIVAYDFEDGRHHVIFTFSSYMCLSFFPHVHWSTGPMLFPFLPSNCVKRFACVCG